MGFYRRRRQLTAEEKAANAAAKAKREAATMTCQVCGRTILANTGVIAHHGYTRPHEGWQTASCMGARHVPFQNDRAVLLQYIKALTDFRDRLIESKRQLEAEECEATFTYVDRKLRFSRGLGTEVTVKVTRETFETEKEKHSGAFLRCSIYSFDVLKKRNIDDLERRIRVLNDDIKHSQARYDGWEKTHEWRTETETWEKVDVN